MSLYFKRQIPAADSLKDTCFKEVIAKIVGISPPFGYPSTNGEKNVAAEWVGQNLTHSLWLTNEGVVDACVLLVDRAIENGNIPPD